MWLLEYSEEKKRTGKLEKGKVVVYWGLDCEYQAVAVVSLGDKVQEPIECESINHGKETVRAAASAGCRSLDAVGIKNISLESLDDSQSSSEGATLGLWKFQEYKSKKDDPPTVSPHTDCNQTQWQQGLIYAQAQNFARRLADTPSNLMTPTIFANSVEEAFKGKPCSVCVRDRQWAASQDMNAFLAVAKGSEEPPVFLEVSYDNGPKDQAPYVLVGKGVTFDSGGISIKPSARMDEMRADMGGAAAVIGAFQGVIDQNLPINLKVLIPLCENMPSGRAVKPGDVIKAKNGKSICVDNTDAEGRLILCDALAYGLGYKPKWMLDVATLTGAMAVALGTAATGVFSTSNGLYGLLEEAGARTGDRVWRMPLWKHYTKQVTDYPAFDVHNTGKGTVGGACKAAAFLREFVGDTTWMHLDIAGVMGPTSEVPYLQAGMTGRPTRTLIDFLQQQAK